MKCAIQRDWNRFANIRERVIKYVLIVHIFARRAKKKIKGTAFALPRFFSPSFVRVMNTTKEEKNLEPQATPNKDHFYTIYVSAVYKLAVFVSLKCQTITMGLVEIQFQGVK